MCWFVLSQQGNAPTIIAGFNRFLLGVIAFFFRLLLCVFISVAALDSYLSIFAVLQSRIELRVNPVFRSLFFLRFYITLKGQRLTGREATRAAEEDKKAVKEGLGPAAKDRSMIMKWVKHPIYSRTRGPYVRYRPPRIVLGINLSVGKFRRCSICNVVYMKR